MRGPKKHNALLCRHRRQRFDGQYSMLDGSAIFANIEITGPLHKDIMRIPASALQKEGVIWIVKDDNTMISTEPDILFSDNDHIAVRNMDGAHKIVTSRVSGASDGMGVMTDDQEEESKAESNTQEQK